MKKQRRRIIGKKKHFKGNLACRAGENLSSERSHRKKFSRHLEFFMQWKTGERKKVLPRG